MHWKSFKDEKPKHDEFIFITCTGKAIGFGKCSRPSAKEPHKYKDDYFSIKFSTTILCNGDMATCDIEKEYDLDDETFWMSLSDLLNVTTINK